MNVETFLVRRNVQAAEILDIDVMPMTLDFALTRFS
jgi:hypothetical protein